MLQPWPATTAPAWRPRHRRLPGPAKRRRHIAPVGSGSGPGPASRRVRPSWRARLAARGAAGLHASRPWNVVEGERPLVVSRRATIRTERGLLTLAADALNAANREAGLRTRARLNGSRSSGRLIRAGWSAGAGGCLARTRNSWLSLSGGDDHELAVLRHRVLVFLAQESALDQDVNAWWKRDGARLLVLGPVQSDGAGVLLAAPHELRLFFALCLVAPHGHGDGQQDGQDRKGHQQRRHRVAAFISARGAPPPLAQPRAFALGCGRRRTTPINSLTT
jgi:hypothetical protein